MNPRHLVIGSAALVAFIAAFEGIEYTPYLDSVGVKTVCAGHTKEVEDREYSPAECAALLKADVESHALDMLTCVSVPITQGELDAYISFAYNVGGDAFCGSTLVAKLNAGDRMGACNELTRWNRAGGKVLRGLVRRRAAERDLCLKGVESERETKGD